MTVAGFPGQPFGYRANPIGSLQLLRGHPELLGLASVSLLANLAHEALAFVIAWAVTRPRTAPALT